MKTSILFLSALCSSIICLSQQATFNQVTLQDVQNRQVLVFTTPREQHVRHFRIEASNDNVNFETIAIVQPKGNNMHATSYQYDLQAYHYNYFRIGMVDMNGQQPYSPSVAKNSNEKIENKHLLIQDSTPNLATK